MSTIIGFNLGVHNANVALIQDGVIKAVYDEERFSNKRMKGETINKSLDALIKDCGVDLSKVDHFVTTTPFVFTDLNVITSQYRHKIQYYPHHYCHALGALIFSGFHERNNVMVLTLDDGDFNIHNLKQGEIIDDKIYDWNLNTKNLTWWLKFKNRHNASAGSMNIYKNGELHLIKEFNANFSRLYFFGATMMIYYYNLSGGNIEEKMMSMSAEGKYNDHVYRTFRNLCVFDKQTESFDNCIPDENKTGNWEHGRLHDTILTVLSEYPKEDVAHSIQKCVEDSCIELIEFYQSKYNCKHICVAGGFFANYRVNQSINEKLNFEEIFVMPATGDHGIAIGAALAKSIELNEYKFDSINHVFFGKSYTHENIRRFVKNRCMNYHDFTHDRIIEDIKSGKVIGIFREREEIGAKSLGNRSIIFDATNVQTLTRFNQIMQRPTNMKFPMIVLGEDVDNIIQNLRSKFAAQFGTISFTVKSDWIGKIPSVVNTYDNTSVVQIVTDSHLHSLLNSYKLSTNIPVLAHTSFNSHCCPVVNTPLQAWEALRDRLIDVLVLGDYIIYYDYRK